MELRLLKSRRVEYRSIHTDVNKAGFLFHLKRRLGDSGKSHNLHVKFNFKNRFRNDRGSCDICFSQEFNVEFPCKVMNFSIEF